MKSYFNIFAAAALLLGFTACSKSGDDINIKPEAQENLVEVVLGADFASTKTTMASNGDVIWSSNDKIKVQVGTNAYDFDLKTGSGTTSATFSAVVPESDAAILKGEAQGTVTAYYPTSGAEVPVTQTYAEGTFADGMNPMTATFANQILTFTNNAAVVRVQGVSATATSAVLTYTVNSTNYSVSMALTAGSAAKDLYFVVVPGAKDFNLAFDGAEAVKYIASAATVAGSRYNIDKPVAKIGDKEYSLVGAFAAVQKDETIQLTADAVVGAQYTISNMLVLEKDNVTLDLNGNTITVTNNFSFGIGANNITVKNGNLYSAYTEETVSKHISYTLTVAAQEPEVRLDGIVLKDLNITGGIRFGGATSAQYHGAGNGKITNCNIESGDFYDVYATYGSEVNIESGSFFSIHENNQECIVAEVGATFVLTGGIFSAKIGLSAADGYKIVDNTDTETKTKYPYAVVVEPATMVYDKSELIAAISNAAAGDIIKFGKSFTIDNRISTDKAITIDLNKNTLTTSDNSGENILTFTGAATIRNGVIKAPNSQAGQTILFAGLGSNVTMKDLEIEGPGIPLWVGGSGNPGTATVKQGCKFTSTGESQYKYNMTAVGLSRAATLNIEGGEFIGKYYACAILSSGGSINITGGILHKGSEKVALRRYSDKSPHTSFENKDYYFSILQDGDGTITISDTAVIQGDICGRTTSDTYNCGQNTTLKINGGYFDNGCTLYNYDDGKVIFSQEMVTAGFTKSLDAYTQGTSGNKNIGTIYTLTVPESRQNK